MLTITPYKALILILGILFTSCGEGGGPFNKVECSKSLLSEPGFLSARTAGEEEKLMPFFQLLGEKLGESKVTYLNYTLEDNDEFFNPEKRRISPDILESPFGIQKILVWDSVFIAAWGELPLQISLQVEQKRRGRRPIDRKNCEIEIRIRNYIGENLLNNCAESGKFKTFFQQLIRESMGSPRADPPSEEWLALEQEYNRRKAEYAQRVAPFLDGDCYPPIIWKPGSKVMRIQLCEDKSLKDTLRAQVLVTDSNCKALPFRLYDIMAEQIVSEVRIYKGFVGYSLFSEKLHKIHEIKFLFKDGGTFIFFKKGDFCEEPLPFKTRYDPSIFLDPKEIPPKIPDSPEVQLAL